ncbi:hypothetical protein Save01_02414 [Streptomyces avermitilis]|nr:aldo/keto reductase [Streptomyces avermitilis]
MTVGLELPHVPVPLAPLVLGTMTFGDTADRSTAAAMVDAALDAGITGVDTANGYAGGESERILAELLPGRRERVVLATKAGIPHPDQGEHAPLSGKGLRAALDGSLKRLGTDHVDLFYLHASAVPPVSSQGTATSPSSSGTRMCRALRPPPLAASFTSTRALLAWEKSTARPVKACRPQLKSKAWPRNSTDPTSLRSKTH